MRCVNFTTSIDSADEVSAQHNAVHGNQFSLFLGDPIGAERVHLILTAESAWAVIGALREALEVSS